jgi:hypothetical protein
MNIMNIPRERTGSEPPDMHLAHHLRALIRTLEKDISAAIQDVFSAGAESIDPNDIPKMASEKAATIMSKHPNILLQVERAIAGKIQQKVRLLLMRATESEGLASLSTIDETDDRLKEKLSDIQGLGARALNAIKFGTGKIISEIEMRDILALSATELDQAGRPGRQFGPVSLQQIRDMLKIRGLKLRED